MSRYRELVWDDPITVYHRIESKDAQGRTVIDWTRFQLSNCFYGMKARQVVAGLQVNSSNVHIVRIPSVEIPHGFGLGKGDIIVKGHVEDELQQNDSGSALRTKYAGNCFVVNRYGDNRSLPATAHLYASED